MPAIQNPTITLVGLNAAIAAGASSVQLQITHLAIGAGQYLPDGNTITNLVDRREKTTIAGYSRPSALSPIISMSAIFQNFVGAQYNVGEIGFYAGDPDAGGILFAVYSAPAYVASVRIPNGVDFTANYVLQLSVVDPLTVTVTVDPLSPISFQLIELHKQDSNAHPKLLRTDSFALISHLAYAF